MLEAALFYREKTTKGIQSNERPGMIVRTYINRAEVIFMQITLA